MLNIYLRFSIYERIYHFVGSELRIMYCYIMVIMIKVLKNFWCFLKRLKTDDHLIYPLVSLSYSNQVVLRMCCHSVQLLCIDGVAFYFCIAAFDKDSSFLLYVNARLGEVKGIGLDLSLTAEKPDDITHEFIEPITWLERPVAVDYHRDSQYIYFSDAPRIGRARIGRRKLDGTNLEEDFIDKGSQHYVFKIISLFVLPSSTRIAKTSEDFNF